MEIRTDKFPHIPRLFSASSLRRGSHTLLWVLLLGLIAFNGYRAYTLTPPAYLPTLIHPFSENAHTSLGTLLWNQGLEKSAKTELNLAQDLYATQQTNVLGASTPPLDLLSQWESVPAQKKALLAFWQQVMSDKPDYRDAYIQAGSLAYQLQNPKEAKEYLTKAYDLDPNSKIITTLLHAVTGN